MGWMYKLWAKTDRKARSPIAEPKGQRLLDLDHTHTQLMFKKKEKKSKAKKIKNLTRRIFEIQEEAFFSRVKLPHSRRFKASGRAHLLRHPHRCYWLWFEEECGTVVRWRVTVGEGNFKELCLMSNKTEMRWALETFSVIWMQGMRVLGWCLLKNAC